ncbi:hypothetical protein Trydic_g14211 [Trypoxylus dichotomus]
MLLSGQRSGQCSQLASAATIATIVVLIGAYAYYRKKRTNVPTVWTPVGKVKQLFIYPMKSGRRRELKRAKCNEHGASLTENNVELRDRSFIVYGEANNEFKTARTFPKLVLIETCIDKNGDVVFTAPGRDPITVKIPNFERTPTIVTVHNRAPVKALDCGDEIAAWLSRYILDKPSGMRLGYHKPHFNRDIKRQFPHLFDGYGKLRIDSAGLYSDLTSYHLINQSSIDELNTHLAEPITANNFRPNVLVEGGDLKAYAEEDWDWIKIGDAVFRNVKPCTRCVFTTIDPEAAVLSKERQPLKTLISTNGLKEPAHIRCEGEKGVMGIHLELWRDGQIQVGDEIFIA